MSDEETNYLEMDPDELAGHVGTIEKTGGKDTPDETNDVDQTGDDKSTGDDVDAKTGQETDQGEGDDKDVETQGITSDGKKEKIAKDVKTKLTKEGEDLLKVVDGQTVLRVKGKDYRVADLPKEELKGYLQQGLRFTQRMQEISDREKQIEEKEALVNRGAELVSRYLTAGGQLKGQPGSQEKVSEEVPAELQFTQYDSDEVRASKEIAQGLHKQVVSLSQQVNNLSATFSTREFQESERALLGQIDSLKADYPCASKDEVIAVKAMYPKVPIEKIMERSDQIYGGRDFLESVLKAHPEYRRELHEAGVKAYLQKQGKTKLPAGTRSGTSFVANADTAKRKPILDFDQAEAALKAHIAERERLAKLHDTE